MKILAIESSGTPAGAAVLEDDTLTAEYTVNFRQTHSRTLLPMIDEVCRMLELDLHTIDAFAVSAGPGSFTGLRIGASTVKGLGLALEKPLIAVPSVDVLAYNLAGAAGLICPLMNARRNQTYTGIYRFSENEMTVLRAQCAVPLEEILEDLNGRGEAVIFLGDGLPVFRTQIEETMRVPFSFAPPHLCMQRAGTLAALAARYYRQGSFVSADDFAPLYLRLSQAERERLEREKALKAGTLKKEP